MTIPSAGPLEALELIAADNTPCYDCGQPHVERDEADADGRVRVTWDASDDGHRYRRMDVCEYAAHVLATLDRTGE